EFLSLGLPVSENFPDWRTGVMQRRQESVSIEQVLTWPLEGICFDIERNNFWMSEWGPRPERLEEALDHARQKVREAPMLIPIFSHRYLPSEPASSGNPIFSVWQTDIICYGIDLKSYLAREFELRVENKGNGNRRPRRIRFWSDVIEKADAEFD